MASVTLSNVEQVIVTTTKAILVRFENQKEVWIPRSVCEAGDQLEKGDHDIMVQEWCAEREGLG